MNDLIRELNHRYKAVKSKTGSHLIVAVCDYLTLLDRPDIQELLLRQKAEPDDGVLNIWQPYQKLVADVYQPYRQHPELFKQTFAHFYFVDEWIDDLPIALFITPKGIKALWQQMKYKNRIDAIHARLPVLLKDRELLASSCAAVRELTPFTAPWRAAAT